MSKNLFIGLSHKQYTLNNFVGLEIHSFGLECETGKYWVGSSLSGFEISPSIKTGDIVGCGVSNYQVYWTLNGEFIGFASQNKVNPDIALFPTISCNGNTKLSINFGEKDNSFSFNVYKKKNSSLLHITVPANMGKCITEV